MFFTKAYAQAQSGDSPIAAGIGLHSGGAQDFLLNIVPIVVLMGLFYVLLIMPQQKRMKEHVKMLDALKKGDDVVTGGGLVGKIEKIINDDEVLITLSDGVKVTALRSTIQSKAPAKPAKKDAKK